MCWHRASNMVDVSLTLHKVKIYSHVGCFSSSKWPCLYILFLKQFILSAGRANWVANVEIKIFEFGWLKHDCRGRYFRDRDMGGVSCICKAKRTRCKGEVKKQIYVSGLCNNVPVHGYRNRGPVSLKGEGKEVVVFLWGRGWLCSVYLAHTSFDVRMDDIDQFDW